MSPLEVDQPYTVDNFLLVSGLERESESFFYNLVLTVVDGNTFLFAGNGEGEILQVRINKVYTYFFTVNDWSINPLQFLVLPSDTIIVRTIETPTEGKDNDVELEQLLISEDGLHIYFSTEDAVSCYN